MGTLQPWLMAIPVRQKGPSGPGQRDVLYSIELAAESDMK